MVDTTNPEADLEWFQAALADLRRDGGRWSHRIWNGPTQGLRLGRGRRARAAQWLERCSGKNRLSLTLSPWGPQMLTLSLIAALHAASLTGEPQAMGTGMLLAQVPLLDPPAGLARPPMTLQQLRGERARLDSERPWRAGPVTMLAVGAGGAVTSVVVGVNAFLMFLPLLVGSGVNWRVDGLGIAGASIVLGLSVVSLAVSLTFAIVGGIRLRRLTDENRAIDTRLEAIDEEIRARESLVSPPRPAPDPVERDP